jgi:RNA polymerase sigma-70 factor (ECF subfamily)
MSVNEQPSVPENRGSFQFTTTHWSVVLAAGGSQATEAASALEQLCGSYWYPLYAFLRRLGHSPADAEDLTQGFFCYLLDAGLIAIADPGAGRFRSFLLGCIQRWLSNQQQRARAAKRGGKSNFISLDALGAEECYALEPATDETPASRFERTWAETLVGKTFQKLEEEFVNGGQQARFESLKSLLLGEVPGSYAELGRHLGIGEGAVKVAVHRLRKRLGQLLRASIAETVADPAEVDAELRHLLRVLGR